MSEGSVVGVVSGGGGLWWPVVSWTAGHRCTDGGRTRAFLGIDQITTIAEDAAPDTVDLPKLVITQGKVWASMDGLPSVRCRGIRWRISGVLLVA